MRDYKRTPKHQSIVYTTEETQANNLEASQARISSGHKTEDRPLPGKAIE
jgi:hypothetical protein